MVSPTHILPKLDEFLLFLQANNYSRETIYNYEKDITTFAIFLTQELKIHFSNLKKTHIEEFKAYLYSLDRKTATGKKSTQLLQSGSVNRYLSSIRRYLKYLIDMDESVPIPPDSIKLVRKEKRLIRVSELDEVVKLIESPTDFEKNKRIAARNRAILETLFATGMRISELIHLKINQIDKKGRIFIMGKGKKERFVYLTPRAKRYIDAYMLIRDDIESDYLFIPYRGRGIDDKDKKLSSNYLQYKIKRYRELLGLNIPISAHGIRRAFATYLAEKGASPAAIQILLGHESLDTTTRYVRVSHKYAEEVHGKFHPLKE